MIIFISAPSKGIVRDDALTQEFLKHLAQLHTDYPEHTFIAPMVEGYALLKYMEIDATWEHWGTYCKRIIEICDEVWILMYPGWKTSVGVTGEITCATKHDKVIRFIPVFNNECLHEE